MLPLLNKARVRVYISPEKITLIHLAGRWQTKIMEHGCVDIDERDPMAGIQILKEWLTERALALPVEVIVSSHYCRFVVLPWSDQLIDEQSRLSLAQVLLQRQYAPELASDYQFSLGALHFGQPQLATALAKTWLAALVSGMAHTACHLASVKPSVAVVWNRFYRTLNTEWLMMIEQNRQIYVQHQQGNIQHLEVRPHQAGLIYANRMVSIFNGPEALHIQGNQHFLQLNPYPMLAVDNAEHSQYALCGVF